MSNKDLEYRMACTEVLEILKHMPKREVAKIPQDVIKTLERYRRYDYRFKYDVNKSIKEQNISKTAKSMLSVFHRDYWVDERVKQLMIAKEKFDKRQKV